MRHGQTDIVQNTEVRKLQTSSKYAKQEDFVLEKSIFANIFEKDIRRVFIYKKTERLAKAIHLIIPAFTESVSLKTRIGEIAIGLIDAAMLPPPSARTSLSRELLMLSSILSIARTNGILSSMNAEIVSREAHALLHEIALYEEPRLSLEEAPTLSTLAKDMLSQEEPRHSTQEASRQHGERPDFNKGHIKDTEQAATDILKDRWESILSIIRNKRTANIKDISMLIRGVSEKTIQRELSSLIVAGKVIKRGERRWSVYSLA